jgi:hypothetical protein
MVNLRVMLLVGASALLLASASSSEGCESCAEGAAMGAYDCVKFVGYNPDSFVYVYQRGHGAQWAASAETAAHREGIVVIKVDVGLLKDREVRLLQCFFGKYSPGEGNFTASPRLLCPRTEESSKLYLSGRPVLGQLRAFARGCA